MNTCMLMAKVVRSPELRYTQDNQTPIAQMLVEFESLRGDDPPSTLKVIGWGNLASEIQEQYTEGDRIIIEGRLSMNTFERPEGFKEKRAELVASRIHRLDGVPATGASATSAPANPMPSYPEPVTEAAPFESEAPAPITDKDLDDIPF